MSCSELLVRRPRLNIVNGLDDVLVLSADWFKLSKIIDVCDWSCFYWQYDLNQERYAWFVPVVILSYVTVG